MENFHRTEGFSLVEVLIVMAVAAVILVAGASNFSGIFALRRSVDEVTNNIGTTLQLAKLKSAREGVEYRLVLASCTSVDSSDPDCEKCDTYSDYSTGDETMNVILERGDSNVGSNTWCMQNTQEKKFQSPINVAMSGNVSTGPLRISFLPSGMRGDFRTDPNAETVSILPAVGAKIDKCGQVEVTPVGGVRVIQGRWDGSNCNAILDPQPTPGP